MNYDQIHLSERTKLITAYRHVLDNTAFLEFGVCRGISMSMWYSLYKDNNLPINFIGFDSFRGLPAEMVDKNSFWKEGAFTTDGNVNPSLIRDGIRLVTGVFSESLTEDAAKLLGPVKAGLVHMDCDTYSSTKTVWNWLIKYNILTKGAIIVYDDWGAWLEAKCGEYEVGEAKAHKEIEETYGLSFIDLGKYTLNHDFYEVKSYIYLG